MVRKKNSVDEYPQLLHLNAVTMATVNTFIEANTNTPVSVSAENHLVMEILKVYLEIHAAFDASGSSMEIQLTSRPKTAVAYFNDPDVIAKEQVFCSGTFAQGQSSEQRAVEIDMQGSDGKGFLFAGPRFYLGLITSGQSTLKPVGTCMILYRLIEVSAAELVGLASQAYN